MHVTVMFTPETHPPDVMIHRTNMGFSITFGNYKKSRITILAPPEIKYIYKKKNIKFFFREIETY